LDSYLRTFKLTVAYEGTNYFGWQVQPNKPTIQGKLQQAIQAITSMSVSVVGSGRTDAGVHALGQVVSCRLPWRGSAEQLGLALNTKLPADITIRESVESVEGFHAIRDAIRKRYRYQLQLGGAVSPFERRYRWHVKTALDFGRMHDAAPLFLGEHDFASFQAAGAERLSTVRTIFDCSVLRQAQSGDHDGDLIAIEIEADGFLYNMVRNIVGSMVEVGSGKRDKQWLHSVFAARNRSKAGPTAPAHGLCLLRVDYPKEIHLSDH